MARMTRKPTAAELRRSAQIMGRIGGLAKSARKTAAARLNATRPRPNRRKKATAA